jgi:hypothetical protein
VTLIIPLAALAFAPRCGRDDSWEWPLIGVRFSLAIAC